MKRTKEIGFLCFFAFMLMIILFYSSNFANAVSEKKYRERMHSVLELEEGFRNVPDSIRLAVYWYWISDHLSVEGVQKDLEEMKKAGITRAFIGNIGIEDLPYGTVKVLSPEWWEVLHAALKKATELDIEIGIFNSPGWSQSGGPWVKPSQSMRYLASADTLVDGGKPLTLVLPQVKSHAANWEVPGETSSTFASERLQGQDVKVIAYRLPEKQDFTQKSWTIKKAAGEKAILDLSLGCDQPARSLIIRTDAPIQTNARLYVKTPSGYSLLKTIELDRSNMKLQTGFYPAAPIVITIPESDGDSYRIEFSEQGACNAEVSLSSCPMVERYAEKSLAKMFPRPLPMFNDYLWDEQPVADASVCIDPAQVLDLSDYVKNGVLTWQAPEGKWMISRTAMLTTGVSNGPASPEGRGLETDKMSEEHIRAHFDAFIGEILRRVPEADRKSFKVVVEDSYETGGQNWTDSMIDDFKAAYKYDPVPFLPVLNGVVVGSQDKSDRFLWDLRRLIADKVSYDYVGGLRKVSNEHGLTTWLENYGHWGFPGEFLQYGGQSDEIGGEFWSEGTLGDIENRAASSCGHIYGKKRIWAESCTAAGNPFGRYPNRMKQRVDRFFTEGINATLLHLYIHQPYNEMKPGVNAWFGNEFNRHNTWFSQMKTFSDYLRRSNFMLQQGLYVADVAYFIGEDTPKMTGECNPELPQGYAFDYINAEVLLTRAEMKDGKLTLPDGMQYRLLILPELKTMRPELLEQIAGFVDKGLAVLGSAPERAPGLCDYPVADETVRSLASQMWGSADSKIHQYGKGLVFNFDSDITSVLNRLNIQPDFDLAASPGIPVSYIHRTLGNADFYFVSNQSEDTVSISPAFRTSTFVPELWQPATGEMRMLPQFSRNGKTTVVPLTLAPLESVFVVFRKKGILQNGSKLNFPKETIIQELDKNWLVSFEPGQNNPSKPVMFDSLQDWTLNEDLAIRYYSGSAVYETRFDYSGNDRESVYLDLGNVMVMATVELNGKSAGGVWTPPYRLNVSDLLQKGENVLRVTVVNNWMNRLIGDQQLPEGERTTHTFVNPWTKDSPLQPSGLMGPVKLTKF